METDVLPLYSCFLRYDTDESGALSRPEVCTMLREWGFLTGKREWDNYLLNTVVDEYLLGRQDLAFPQFLRLVTDVRDEAKRLCFDETQAQFKRFDKNNSKALSVAELSKLFIEMGLAPKGREEQEAIQKLVLSCDDDGSGELDINEFSNLVQLVKEKQHSLRLYKDIERGIELGFAESQVREYRKHFWDLDVDNTGTLDLNEMRALMQKLHLPITNDQVRKVMVRVDLDQSGQVSFQEFLYLVHLLEETLAEASAMGYNNSIGGTSACSDEEMMAAMRSPVWQ